MPNKESLNRYIVLLALIVTLGACTGLPDGEFELQPTEIRVRVLGEDFKPTNSGTVALYRDFISFSTRTGEVATAPIDATGYAEFNDLEPVNYFIYAEKTDGTSVYNNEAGAFNLYDYLTENAITSVSVVLQKQRDQEPDSIQISEIGSIAQEPIASWKTIPFDTIYGEIFIVRNYDYFFSPDDQDVVHRSDYHLQKSLSAGTWISLSSPYDIKLPISGLRYFYSDPEPGKDSYSIIQTAFTTKADFERRTEILQGTIQSTGEYRVSSFELSDAILSNADMMFPYTPTLYLGANYDLHFNFRSFIKVQWK